MHYFVLQLRNLLNLFVLLQLEFEQFYCEVLVVSPRCVLTAVSFLVVWPVAPVRIAIFVAMRTDVVPLLVLEVTHHWIVELVAITSFFGL